MAKDEEKRTVTLDIDALNALIDAKVQARVAEAAAKSTVDATDFERAMREVRGQDRPAAEIRYEDCESPLTGARFRAKIQASRKSALGIVIDITDGYTFPPGVEVPQSRGGIMPDEFVPAVEAPDSESGGALLVKYNHWKYWEFVRRDMIEFAGGKPFVAYLRASEADRRRAEQAAAERQAAAAQ